MSMSCGMRLLDRNRSVKNPIWFFHSCGSDLQLFKDQKGTMNPMKIFSLTVTIYTLTTILGYFSANFRNQLRNLFSFWWALIREQSYWSRLKWDHLHEQMITSNTHVSKGSTVSTLVIFCAVMKSTSCVCWNILIRVSILGSTELMPALAYNPRSLDTASPTELRENIYIAGETDESHTVAEYIWRIHFSRWGESPPLHSGKTTDSLSLVDLAGSDFNKI